VEVGLKRRARILGSSSAKMGVQVGVTCEPRQETREPNARKHRPGTKSGFGGDRGGFLTLQAKDTQYSVEGRRVMAPGFGSKAEKEEENNGASWGGPTGELETDDDTIIRPPDYRRDHLNTGEVVVSLLPANPWFDRLRGRVDGYEEDCEGRRTHHLYAGDGHETEVSACGQRAIGTQELSKLSLALEETAQSKD